MHTDTGSVGRSPWFDRLMQSCLQQKLLVLLMAGLLLVAGVAFAPFGWKTGMPLEPVAVDAIPNLGENQQIVFTDWPGRSPQDVEDQISYPLSVALMGVPGVKDVRSLSMFGFSSIAVIFDDSVEFYWSRTRLLEKLASLPPDALPDGVQPTLGPDATALGQVFLYTLEGRDPAGNTTSGWDLDELRSVQDWYLRTGLLAAEGISEVASIGGYQREYQVEVDPDLLRMHRVTLSQVTSAVMAANLDVSAGSRELNGVEYLIRGVGFVKQLSDIEQAVVRLAPDNTPIRVADVARVQFGPAERRGALDVNGAEAVGGVVTVREGYNPRQAIANVKRRLDEVQRGLPAKAVIDWQQVTAAEVDAFARDWQLPAWQGRDPTVQDDWLGFLRAQPADSWPSWLTLSQLTVVPFYDRSGLIDETLGTLQDALSQQLLVTVVVVLALLLHFRAALAVSLMLPMAVLLSFIAMKWLAVDANIVALAGIAIAIGTIVDMGIIVSENLLRQRQQQPDLTAIAAVRRAGHEVGPAIVTAISTTVISFLPVFTMTGAEGKLFGPLAYTKTFVLLSAALLALTVLPVLLALLFRWRKADAWQAWQQHLLSSARWWLLAAFVLLAIWFGSALLWLASLFYAAVLLWSGYRASVWKKLQPFPLCQSIERRLRAFGQRYSLPAALLWRLGHGLLVILVLLAAVTLLSQVWLPLGPLAGSLANWGFVTMLLAGVLGFFMLFLWGYPWLLATFLRLKWLFLALPVLVIGFGLTVWLGAQQTLGWLPGHWQHSERWPSSLYHKLTHRYPGLGREFMPALDEGAFLLMPSLMPHASIGEALAVLQQQDAAIAAIPEVRSVVGKIGRAETALDPAPLGMIETLIQYHSEFKTDAAGRRLAFRYDNRAGDFVRDEQGELIEDPRGRPYRQWREHILSPDDIWQEIVRAAQLPGVTSAPKLQPIETRLLMLQTGMRAAMGVKLSAPDLATLDQLAVELEQLLRQAPGVQAASVSAERIVGQPYLEIHPDRAAIARYGVSMQQVQQAIATAIGGMEVGRTVEGRERYGITVRYQRERRDSLEHLAEVLIDTASGYPVPLTQLAEIRYQRGPQMIRSENTFLTAYVTFGSLSGWAEVDVVDEVAAYLNAAIARGDWQLPAGASYSFAGSFEHQQRASQTLQWVIPLSLVLIFMLLYLQFKRVSTALMIFSSIAVAWSGGFIMLDLFAQPWFLNIDWFDTNLRSLFQLQSYHLSIAVWVGFLALFGIAVDDGVVMATYLKQQFSAAKPQSRSEVRALVMQAAQKRIRPCLMTSATTMLALLPVLTATGRGADLMIPMAIPTLGGMFFVLLSVFMVPVLYAMVEERRLAR
ncbi:efflux RND transporter permease subunit [Alkalimonas mucilaginosa]|uniref:Efflux RND transporter permease subunit n=1 Tax=Alkalimonas mucilaginosa TaxID=3057676 RepID=A0ABU7JDS0_9GAMM|nr:efflux RND transporter permease subunit [Alkalimonas sp. MEB004]MEE2023839.1 efflux RND transporter permease subunit [Alkalimonas sp. MEB004]